MISNWKEYWKKLLHQSAKKIDDELFKGTIYLLNNLTIPQTDVKTLISFLSCLEGIASFNTFHSAWFTTLLAIVTCYCCVLINMRIQDVIFEGKKMRPLGIPSGNANLFQIPFLTHEQAILGTRLCFYSKIYIFFGTMCLNIPINLYFSC